MRSLYSITVLACITALSLAQKGAVRILRNDSSIILGEKEDVRLVRSGDKAATLTASLNVQGALRTSSSGGSVYPHFYNYHAPAGVSIKKGYLYIKTNIPMDRDTQFRFKLEGFAPYSSKGNIDSSVVGWRQQSKGKKDCVVNMHSVNNGAGIIGAYCDSNTGEVVVGLDLEDARDLGVSLTAFLVNSKGSTHDLKVTDVALTTEMKFFAPSSKNCNDLRKQGNTKSGIYEIKPNEELPAIKVYCDMVTDGGGWTLVAGFQKQSGFAMYSHRANGYRVGELIKNPTGMESAPTLLSQKYMEGIWFSGKQEYMSLCGRTTSGSIVVKFSMNSPKKAGTFDVFRGIYDARYTKQAGVTARLWEGGNGNPLGAGVKFGSAVGLGTQRDCGNTGTKANCYHYLPDDINGGGRWAFRENIDDTPAQYGGSSSQVPSKIFIR